MTSLDRYIRYIEDDSIGKLKRAIELLEGGLRVGNQNPDTGEWVDETDKELAAFRVALDNHERALVLLKQRRKQEQG